MSSFQRLIIPIQGLQPNFDFTRQLEQAAFELDAEHDSRYRSARQHYLRQLLFDLNQPKHVRGWIKQELNRLEQAERARQLGKKPPGGSSRNLRGVPGLDVGHKLGLHNQHSPANFRLEDAKFNRARPGISRRLGLFNRYREGETAFESSLKHAAEHMDAWDALSGVKDIWDTLNDLDIPSEVKDEIKRRVSLKWQLSINNLSRFLKAFVQSFLRNPQAWKQALLGANRSHAIDQLSLSAAQMTGLAPNYPVQKPRGMSDKQVKQYHRRQYQRGVKPGRNRQAGRNRQHEYEHSWNEILNIASYELENAEPFFTRVTPIPGIGNKEGHEVLTRLAMRGLPLTTAEKAAVELGVIRPDRGGQSYWNFPRAALASLKAAAQPAHALRPTPSASVAAALRLIHQKFIELYRKAVSAKSRSMAYSWLGEALHLLQDSFSSAHVERVSGTGSIRNIRAFYIRVGWPPLSRAPHEHNAPSDPRDDVYLHGRLRPEATAAVLASREFLKMAIRHLNAPLSSGNAAELITFIRRYLS